MTSRVRPTCPKVVARRRGAGARRGLAWLAAACAVIAPVAAGARCIAIGVLFSCTTVNGGHLQLACFGSGQIQSCIADNGQWALVGPHWRDDMSTGVSTQGSSSQLTSTEAIPFESLLSSALAANPTFGSSPSTPPRQGQ
jgi:hypothetical protein